SEQGRGYGQLKSEAGLVDPEADSRLQRLEANQRAAAAGDALASNVLDSRLLERGDLAPDLIARELNVDLAVRHAVDDQIEHGTMVIGRRGSRGRGDETHHDGQDGEWAPNTARANHRLARSGRAGSTGRLEAALEHVSTDLDVDQHDAQGRAVACAEAELVL